MTPRVYSYLRFSDPKQATGSSVDRQTEYARRWAAERGLVLDEALSMRDEGLSAYHQRHVKSGALGLFLVAVDEGRIAAGSVLVVEGLDRLSRAEPIPARTRHSRFAPGWPRPARESENWNSRLSASRRRCWKLPTRRRWHSRGGRGNWNSSWPENRRTRTSSSRIWP